MIGIIILLGWTIKSREKRKKGRETSLKAHGKKFDSPVNLSTDHQQNDCESQSSGKENEWDGKETAETALKAVSDATEPVKLILSAAVPEVQMRVITSHVPPVTLKRHQTLKKFVFSYLLKKRYNCSFLE